MGMTNATLDPADWTQFFHENTFVGHPSYPHHPFIPTSVSAESTVVTTVPPGSAGGGGIGRSSTEKHVGKAPPRKRSRSSRRAPTTLLNTDAANFRAMVQQFTGAPTTPFTAASGTGGQSAIRFGFGYPDLNQQSAGARLGNYRPPQYQQQQEMVRFSTDGKSLGEEEEEIMPRFFFDGMAGAVQVEIPEQMGREGGGYF